ncbi:MAG: tetratricopeptide repeat protein [Candidatus Obscuribacter sp.]|nr:tetratricopeptide repeat protein [Candidatus Obscuribacter sp.]
MGLRKSLSVSLSLVLGLAVVLPGATLASVSRSHYEKAMLMQSDEHHRDAINEFGLAIKENPRDAASYLGRGVSLICLDQYGEAAKDLSRSISLDPHLWRSHGWLGFCYLVAGQTEKGISELNNAISGWGPDISLVERSDILSNRGKAYKKLGKRQQAEQDMALSRKHAVLKAAKESRENGDIGTALKLCDKACAELPDLADAFFLRGCVYLNQDRLKEALADFNRAIKLTPVYPGFYYFRADCLTEMGRIDEAIADYSKVLTFKPRLVAMEFTFETGRRRGNSDMTDSCPVNLADIYILRGHLFNLKKKYEAAIADFSEAIKRDPLEVEAFIERAKAEGALKRFSQAEADLTRALKLNGRKWDIFLTRAKMNEARGSYALAETDYNLLVDESDNHGDSTSSGARVMRGQFFEKNGKLDKALADYDFCLKKDAGNEEALKSRADIYMKLKRPQSALRDYRKLLQVAGSDRALAEVARAGIARATSAPK